MAQAMRSPGVLGATTFMENAVIDSVAAYINTDPFTIREANKYPTPGANPLDKQKISPGGMDISDIDPAKVINHLKRSADYENRKKEVEEFNTNNKWIKKGLSLLVHRYPVFGDWKVT